MARWSAWLIAATLLGGAALTWWGLVQGGLLTYTDVPDPELYLVLGMVALAGAACEGVGRSMRTDRCTAGLAVGALGVLLAGQAGAVLMLILLAAASFVAGHVVLSLLRCAATATPWTVRLGVGAGLLGTLVGIAAHFPVAYPVSYAAALLAVVIFGQNVLRDALSSLPASHGRPRSWLDLPLAMLGLYYLGVALMPEAGHDALAIHLFVPAHLALRHEWGFDPSIYVWAVIPMLGDWLYGIGYVLAGEAGARLVNLGAVLLGCRLVGELAERAGADRQGSRWASLLFLSTPLVFTEASSLFIESVWSCFLMAASLALLRLLPDEKSEPPSRNEVRAALVASGLLAGGALATKAVTFTVLPGLVILMAACWKRCSGPGGLRAVGLGVVLGAAVGLVPYLWAWHATGNPVFPFFNDVFRSPLWPAIAFEPPPAFDKGVRWDLFWRMTFDSGRYLEASPGAAGFQWLLLVVPATLALAVNRGRAGLWMLVIAAVSVVLTFHSTAYLRYVMPAFGWVAAAIGAAMAVPIFGRHWLRALITLAVAAAVALNVWFMESGTHYGDFAPKVLLGPMERARYLTERYPMRNLVSVLNTVNDPGAPVAVFGPPLLAGLAADALHASWYNQSFLDDVLRARNAAALGEMLDGRGVEHVVLDPAWGASDRRELVRQATDPVAVVGEVELRRLKPQFQFRTELLRDPGLNTLTEWGFPGGRLPSHNRGLTVSVSKPAIQAIAVKPGRRYRLGLRARCLDGQPAKGRLQVNWMGGRGLVEVAIRPFDCASEGSNHSMIVSAPAGARRAVVYAVGHSDTPILIEEVSFRQ